MNIGILTNTYAPNLNGVSVAVQSLEQSLKAKGHQVFIATPKIEGASYPDNVLAIQAAEISKNVSEDLKIPSFYVNAVTKFFAERGVEIVHTHDTIIGGPEGVMVALNLGVPCIHTYHTLIESYKYFNFPGYQAFIRNYNKEVCNCYDHITSPSTKIYNYLLEIGVNRPITRILNVPKMEELEQTVISHMIDQKRQELGIGPNDFVYISFCRVAKEKGLDVGLEIMAPILHQYKHAKYLICGDGPEKENLMVLARELGVENQVIFSGKYQRTELPLLASLAKVFVFTSTTENLPTNLFEAMYLGLPVVAIDDPSVDYILSNGVNGLKRPLEGLTEACNLMYVQDAQRELMGLEAKKAAIELKTADITQEYVNLYRRVLEFYHEHKKDTVTLDRPSKRFYQVLEQSINGFRGTYRKMMDAWGSGR